MNKVAITFIIVVISLAVIIQMDFSAEDIMPNIKPQSVSSADIYNQCSIEYNLFNNIQYIKENSLSLRDNRLLSVLITQDMYGIKKLINKIISHTIIYHYQTEDCSKNNEIINTVLSLPNINLSVIAKLPVNDNVSPLAYAVYINNIYAVEKLIKLVVDINQQMPTNKTAAFFARKKPVLIY